ncbi:hypothetical protein [Thalassolituus oleivorans]|uniref:hypothetical protein n=1 Tax=Thalassolituus oleivorans TaxID=187493 RepID=UPI001CE39BA5|nr:hypothetical protein [Thalassolituus oleivorans]MCA6127444.1 hypothetical protein [Thalassolituus oleivorans 4BN06-13]
MTTLTKVLGHGAVAMAMALSLTACNWGDEVIDEIGTDDPTTDPVDPDPVDPAPVDLSGLPAANSALSTTSPEGIWMLIATENSTLPNDADSMNPFNFTSTSRELVAISANTDGIYTVTRCESGWRDAYTLTATADGYTATLSETTAADSSGVSYTTDTNFTVAYSSDFQTLTVNGSAITTPVGENLTLAIEGVKVSDSTDFSAAPELTYTYNLDYTNLGTAGEQTSAIAQCIGVQTATKTTEQPNDVWQVDQSEYTFYNASNQQLQYYRFDQNIDGVITNTLGATINTAAVTTLYINTCNDTEPDCNAAANWTEAISNDATTVAFDVNYEVVNNDYVINPLALTPFTAFLWPHDGDFMHGAASVVINPVAP